MAVKTWSVGDVLAAADMNVWTVPVAVVKPSDTPRTSNVTLANDPDLVLPLAAASIYHVTGVVTYAGASMAAPGDPGGLKWAFTEPAGASGQYWNARFNASGVLASNFSLDWAGTNTANTQGTGSNLNLPFIGIITTAGSAGNLTFQWSQVNTSGTSTTVRAASYLVAQRIG